MILKETLAASLTMFLFRYCYARYERSRQRLNYTYQTSLSRLLAARIWEKIKTYFRYSFLGRVTETEQAKFSILDNSRLVQYLLNFYNSWSQKAVFCLKVSSTAELAKDIKDEFNLLGMRTAGIIIFTTVVVNVCLSLVLRRSITLWGWLVRGLFLFLAFGVLSAQADWLTIKKGSIIVKLFAKNN